jgi:hypothetical protein
MKIFNYLFLVSVLVFTVSCDKKEEEPDITINDLVGSWEATSYIITNNANADQTIDLIAFGADLSFTMLEGGGVRTWLTVGTISDEWDAQAEITNGKTLTMTPVEASRGVNTFEIDLVNNTLVLTNANDSFDFTLQDATKVSATSVSTFVRK